MDWRGYEGTRKKLPSSKKDMNEFGNETVYLEKVRANLEWISRNSGGVGNITTRMEFINMDNYNGYK